MKYRKGHDLIINCLVFVLAATVAVLAQGPSNSSQDAELDRVKGMIRQAWQESEQFIKSGGKTDDANHPNKKWAATLWQYREQHPGTPAAARATSEALHLLVHAGQADEAIAKADALKLDDGAWKHLVSVLMEAAREKGSYDFLISKASSLIRHSTDKEVRVRAQFSLAEAYWKKGENDRAKTAFLAVIADYPGTPHAKDAEGNIHEIEFLNLGQPAPVFANRAIGGEPISISDLKGRVVLLNFWASW